MKKKRDLDVSGLEASILLHLQAQAKGCPSGIDGKVMVGLPIFRDLKVSEPQIRGAIASLREKGLPFAENENFLPWTADVEDVVRQMLTMPDRGILKDVLIRLDH